MKAIHLNGNNKSVMKIIETFSFRKRAIKAYFDGFITISELEDIGVKFVRTFSALPEN